MMNLGLKVKLTSNKLMHMKLIHNNSRTIEISYIVFYQSLSKD